MKCRHCATTITKGKYCSVACYHASRKVSSRFRYSEFDPSRRQPKDGNRPLSA